MNRSIDCGIRVRFLDEESTYNLECTDILPAAVDAAHEITAQQRQHANLKEEHDLIREREIFLKAALQLLDFNIPQFTNGYMDGTVGSLHHLDNGSRDADSMTPPILEDEGASENPLRRSMDRGQDREAREAGFLRRVDRNFEVLRLGVLRKVSRATGVGGVVGGVGGALASIGASMAAGRVSGATPPVAWKSKYSEVRHGWFTYYDDVDDSGPGNSSTSNSGGGDSGSSSVSSSGISGGGVWGMHDHQTIDITTDVVTAAALRLGDESMAINLYQHSNASGTEGGGADGGADMAHDSGWKHKLRLRPGIVRSRSASLVSHSSHASHADDSGIADASDAPLTQESRQRPHRVAVRGRGTIAGAGRGSRVKRRSIPLVAGVTTCRRVAIKPSTLARTLNLPFGGKEGATSSGSSGSWPSNFKLRTPLKLHRPKTPVRFGASTKAATATVAIASSTPGTGAAGTGGVAGYSNCRNDSQQPWRAPTSTTMQATAGAAGAGLHGGGDGQGADMETETDGDCEAEAEADFEVDDIEYVAAECAFEIALRDGPRRTFLAHSAAECQAWVQAINSALLEPVPRDAGAAANLADGLLGAESYGGSPRERYSQQFHQQQFHQHLRARQCSAANGEDGSLSSGLPASHAPHSSSISSGASSLQAADKPLRRNPFSTQTKIKNHHHHHHHHHHEDTKICPDNGAESEANSEASVDDSAAPGCEALGPASVTSDSASTAAAQCRMGEVAGTAGCTPRLRCSMEGAAAPHAAGMCRFIGLQRRFELLRSEQHYKALVAQLARRRAAFTVPVAFIKYKYSGTSSNAFVPDSPRPSAVTGARARAVEVAGPSSASVNTYSLVHSQMWKDLQRDEICVNGEYASGGEHSWLAQKEEEQQQQGGGMSATSRDGGGRAGRRAGGGAEAIIGLLMRHLSDAADRVSQNSDSSSTFSTSADATGAADLRFSESELLYCAKEVLSRCNRTQSGGDTYFSVDCLMCCSGASSSGLPAGEQLCILSPHSMQAEAMQVSVEAVRVNFSKSNEWLGLPDDKLLHYQKPQRQRARREEDDGDVLGTSTHYYPVGDPPGGAFLCRSDTSGDSSPGLSPGLHPGLLPVPGSVNASLDELDHRGHRGLDISGGRGGAGGKGGAYVEEADGDAHEFAVRMLSSSTVTSPEDKQPPRLTPRPVSQQQQQQQQQQRPERVVVQTAGQEWGVASANRSGVRVVQGQRALSFHAQHSRTTPRYADSDDDVDSDTDHQHSVSIGAGRPLPHNQQRQHLPLGTGDAFKHPHSASRRPQLNLLDLEELDSAGGAAVQAALGGDYTAYFGRSPSLLLSSAARSSALVAVGPLSSYESSEMHTDAQPVAAWSSTDRCAHSTVHTPEVVAHADRGASPGESSSHASISRHPGRGVATSGSGSMALTSRETPPLLEPSLSSEFSALLDDNSLLCASVAASSSAGQSRAGSGNYSLQLPQEHPPPSTQSQFHHVNMLSGSHAQGGNAGALRAQQTQVQPSIAPVAAPHHQAQAPAGKSLQSSSTSAHSPDRSMARRTGGGGGPDDMTIVSDVTFDTAGGHSHSTAGTLTTTASHSSSSRNAANRALARSACKAGASSGLQEMGETEEEVDGVEGDDDEDADSAAGRFPAALTAGGAGEGGDAGSVQHYDRKAVRVKSRIMRLIKSRMTGKKYDKSDKRDKSHGGSKGGREPAGDDTTSSSDKSRARVLLRAHSIHQIDTSSCGTLESDPALASASSAKKTSNPFSIFTPTSRQGGGGGKLAGLSGLGRSASKYSSNTRYARDDLDATTPSASSTRKSHMKLNRLGLLTPGASKTAAAVSCKPRRGSDGDAKEYIPDGSVVHGARQGGGPAGPTDPAGPADIHSSSSGASRLTTRGEAGGSRGAGGVRSSLCLRLRVSGVSKYRCCSTNPQGVEEEDNWAEVEGCFQQTFFLFPSASTAGGYGGGSSSSRHQNCRLAMSERLVTIKFVGSSAAMS